MSIIHPHFDSRGEVTGTLTVWNSQGSTVTQAASDMVLPNDWNSGHKEVVTISSQTAGDASTASATNVVLGGTGGVQVNMSTAAGAATQWVSRVEADNVMSEYQPISGSAIITNSSLGQNSIYVVPFYLSKAVYVSRVNFPVSVGTAVSAGNNSGTAGITFSAALYSRMTDADSNSGISRAWSQSLALSGVRSSDTNLQLTNVVGISNSTAVSTVATTLNTSNATTYVANSMGGYRMWCLPMNSTLTPGRYWMAVAASTTASSNSNRMRFRASVGMQTVGAVNQIGYVRVGTSSSASNISQNRIWLGAGTYSTTSGAFPNTICINSNSVQAGLTLTLPYFNFSGHNTSNSVL